MTTKRALILTGKFVTDCEYVFPFYRLKEAGFDVDVATKNKETVFGIIGEKIVPTMGLPTPDMALDDYTREVRWKLLILPGGAKAMEYLRQEQDALSFIAAHHAAGGVIGCICHAAQLLISARLVKGRRISGYYSIRDDIVNAGGTYVDEPAVVDGTICTTAHYKDMAPWMREILKLANG